ncbi:GL14663 [Drosophila persimilis]|uniref:GL14663 n=1 Tax=Drosophila persimilis TaxID=7234 RepID=B4GVJ4_DROPE|nr:GL14663 [Drosophila persimilis]
MIPVDPSKTHLSPVQSVKLPILHQTYPAEIHLLTHEIVLLIEGSAPPQRRQQQLPSSCGQRKPGPEQPFLFVSN